jgi:serine/threonine protein kinase
MLIIGSLISPEKQLWPLGEKLGDGRDGEVFVSSDDPDRVIKYSILLDLEFDNDLSSRYSETEHLLRFIHDNPQSHLVRVWGWGFVSAGSRSTVDGEQDYLVYYTLMEKLNKLSEDEKKVFHSILSHEDADVKKLFGRERLREILDGMATGLEFNRDQVETFYFAAINSPLYHNDIHPRNILKDDYGNFKLCDLDHLTIKE